MGNQPDPNAGPGDNPEPDPAASPDPQTSPGLPAPPAPAGPPGPPASPGTPGPAGTPAPAGGPAAAPAGAAREAILAGFADGGSWAARLPGPELAAAVAVAAGDGWRCTGATGEQMIGVLNRIAALEAWMAAGKLGLIRALIRDDGPAFPGGSRHGGLPDAWDDSLTHEIALALAASAPSADKTMRAAWELGARLPEIGALLQSGVINAGKARLITEIFQELSDDSAGRAEQLLVMELAEPPAKTYAQVERAATAIALMIDPHLGERRREAAEKHRARVEMFRERAGTAALSGRDLPTDQTLAAFANVNARAALYKAAPVFAKARMDQLRAAAYLDLLNDISAQDRIAHGLLTEQTPTQHHDSAAPGPGPDGQPRPGGTDCPCRECDGSCLPDDDSPGDDDPGDDDPGDNDPGDGSGPGGSGPDGGAAPGGRAGGESRSPDGTPGPGPGPSPSPSPAPAPARGPDSPHPVQQDLIIPLATLLGLADRPGEGHGLGTLDPGLCRTLAHTAVLSPHTTLCLTITDHDGTATGHGCAKPAPPPTPAGARQPPHTSGPAPPLTTLPARIHLTITARQLTELLSAASGQPDRPGTARKAGLSPLGTHPARRSRHAGGPALTGRPRLVPPLDTDPARRPGTHPAPRARAHVRMRPPLRITRLPAQRQTPAPGPGPRLPVHLPDLLPPRQGQRLRARHALRQRRTDLRLQHRSQKPAMPPSQAVTRLERHPAQTRLAPMDNTTRPHLHPRTQPIPRMTTGML